jgi:Protein kinase domain
MRHGRNSNATTGYTEAVDLWSLGCVTVVLLTGGYPFFDPESSEYSEKLAITCNLQPLEKSQTWQDVGVRPKDFVRRLLVLDERQRMTAKEALTHEWFTNNVHKSDFEELYRRAIRHWRPRMPRDPVIELIEVDNLQKFSFLQDISPSRQRSRKKCPLPVDPPYKPFPRRLHTQVFFPKRRTSPFNVTMSDDVKAAIESSWNFEQRHSAGSSGEENDLPMPRAFEVSKGSDNISTVELQGQCLLPSSTSLATLSKKPRFQPLRPKVSLTCTDPFKASEKNGSETKSRRTESDCAEFEEKDMAPVRKAYSPIAWRREAEAMTSTPNSKAMHTLPNRPVAPRPPKAFGYSKSGTDLPLTSWNNVRIPRNSRCFPEKSAFEGVEQSDQTVRPVDEEASLGDRHDLHSASGSPSSDRQMRADHPFQSILEAIQGKAILDSEPEEGAECSRSIPSSLRAFPTKKDVSIDAVRSEMAIIGHRLNSPTHAIGDILQGRSFNVKKRRSLSIFDFEEDATGSAPGQSKKAKFDQENVKRDGKPTLINAVFPETRANHGRAGSTSLYAQKIFDQTSHADDLYLPRI